MYQDKTLVCRDCGAEFVFTAGEQEFYAEKGFQNPLQGMPHCPEGQPCQCATRILRNGVRRLRQAHHRPLRAQERPAHLLQRMLRRSPSRLSEPKVREKAFAEELFHR